MLGKVHLLAGLLGLVVFVLQGQDMDLEHEHLAGMADAPRMLYRSSHIYLLLVSITNVVIGAYYSKDVPVVPAPVQALVSGVLLASPVALLAGFFLEPGLQELSRPFSRPALYALFGTAIILALAKLFWNPRR